MTKENFCYWLQGFFEIGKFPSISALELDIIKEHLALANGKLDNKPQQIPEIKSTRITIPELNPVSLKDYLKELELSNNNTKDIDDLQIC